jgi:hypothetical protein
MSTANETVEDTTDILLISGTIFAFGYEVGADVAFEDRLNGVGAMDKVGENVAVGKLVGDSSTNVFDITGLLTLKTLVLVAATRPVDLEEEVDEASLRLPLSIIVPEPDCSLRRLVESSRNVIWQSQVTAELP